MPNQFNSQMGYGSGQPSSQYMQHSQQQSQSYNTTTPHQQQNFASQSSSSQPAGSVGVTTSSASLSPSIQPSPNHQQQPPQPSPSQPSPQQQQRLDGPQQDQGSAQSKERKASSAQLTSPLGSPQAQENSQVRVLIFSSYNVLGIFFSEKEHMQSLVLHLQRSNLGLTLFDGELSLSEIQIWNMC